MVLTPVINFPKILHSQTNLEVKSKLLEKSTKVWHICITDASTLNLVRNINVYRMIVIHSL